MMDTNEQKVTSVLEVADMTCGSCVAHVNRALRDLDGIARVDVRLREGTVVVDHAVSTTPESMIEALHEAGYESTIKG